MSPKTAIQLIIVIIIFIILGGVYFKYFSKEKIAINETPLQTEKEINLNSIDNNKERDESEVVNTTNKDKSNKEKNFEKTKINLEKSKKKNSEKKNDKPNTSKKEDNEIPNIVKEVEYLTTDKNGNKYKILATSGRTNQNDKNILDLDDVRGEITSNQRSTIYIISDFAEYNSSSLGSKFYKNVVINYEDIQITCENFDISMDTNIAIAYNNVVVTDPKSTMKAGKITLNIETKEININPDKNGKSKVHINTKK